MVRPADLIVHSGKLWSAGHLPDQDAVAVGGGRILATGSSADLEPFRSETTTMIDAGGRRIMPGLIDSHLHMVRAGLRWNEDVRWHDLASLSEALEAIAQAAQTREPGLWLAVMGGWNPHQFTEKRPPSRQELDEAAPENPVFVQRNYIEAFLNTRALKEMGWQSEPDWRVTGRVSLQSLREKLTAPGFEKQVDGTREMLRQLNRLGLTGCIDTGGFGMVPAAYGPITELSQSAGLGFRARLLVGASRPGNEEAQLDEWMAQVEAGSGEDFLRYLGAGEVLLLAAHDMEGLDRLDISSERHQLAELTRRLADARWPVHLHAILDDSVTTVLDAWEAIGSGSELADLRFAITHADQVSESNLKRIRDLGLGVTVQNGMAFRGADSTPTWGEERVRRSPPLRTMSELGLPMGAGTDGTVVSSPNPWRCIWWMVTGESLDGSGPRAIEERLTIDQALGLYTSGSAWFSFEEETRGMLRAGSHADLIVLSDDPLTVSVERIARIESVLTVVGGEVVHAGLDL